MSDQQLRGLERIYAASGLLEDRERLMAAGARTRMSFAWARRVMSGPSMETFLTWRNRTGTIHLARALEAIEGRRGAAAPLLCRSDTSAGRPTGLHFTAYVTWPLHLVWRKQEEVSCRLCQRAARRFRVVSDPRFTLDGQPPHDPNQWGLHLPERQAAFWGLWHPILWRAGLPVGLP